MGFLSSLLGNAGSSQGSGGGIPPSRTIQGKTQQCHIVVRNRADVPLRLMWLDFQGGRREYATIQPGGHYVSRTFDTHTWLIEDEGGEIWSWYQGPAAAISVHAPGRADVERIVEGACHPQYGEFCERSRCAHHALPIKAHSCVRTDATQLAARTIDAMLRGVPPDIMRRLEAAGAEYAIVGQDQVTSDIPGFQYKKYAVDAGGRGVDQSRGQGATKELPVTTFAEDNVLMLPCCGHVNESILVHEVAHSVMNLGFDAPLWAEIKRCYESAMRQNLYNKQAYIATNQAEYWAEGSQAWFEATVRTDVTSGVRCKAELVERDPDLSRLMLRVYGENDWVYMDSAPGKFRSAPPRCARMTVAEVRRRLAGGHGGPARPSAAAGGAAAPGTLSGMLSGLGSKAKSKLAAFAREVS